MREKIFITSRNEVVAKVIFLHLLVILFTGGGSALMHAGIPTPPPPRNQAPTPLTRQTPPGPGRPPGNRQPPPDQADPPNQAPTPQDQADPPLGPGRPPLEQADPPDQADPPPRTRQTPLRSRLQHTVYEQPVRILLECILVLTLIHTSVIFQIPRIH